MRLRIFPIIIFVFLIVGPASAVTFEELNALFGIPLWTDENLWDDDVAATAKRLGWPVESNISTDSSYRKYPGAEEVVLGTRPQSLALYGENNHPLRLSLMFANRGDSVDFLFDVEDAKLKREQERRQAKQMRDFKGAIQKDAKTISAALTGLLGPPAVDRFGQGRQTRESVQRWDWNGHAFLLASPRDEYVALRILPLELADTQGKARIPDAEMKERLLARVEERPNGDVILKDMPMVDQGPKGYCVPATWERVMRYMGIPADMYILAMAGTTKTGGGTYVADLVNAAREAITRGGRRLDSEKGKISMATVKKYVRKGVPLMWTMFSLPEVNQDLGARMGPRQAMSDPIEWEKSLTPARLAAKRIQHNFKHGHMCMIIGYNEKTKEIAVSDSWGPQFAERWMTVEEANAVSQGEFMIINL